MKGMYPSYLIDEQATRFLNNKFLIKDEKQKSKQLYFTNFP